MRYLSVFSPNAKKLDQNNSKYGHFSRSEQKGQLTLLQAGFIFRGFELCQSLYPVNKSYVVKENVVSDMPLCYY